VLDGSVISQCKPRHQHQEFISFLSHLDRNVPAGLEIDLIADNYATHKHPRVKAWIARHPRFHIHSMFLTASCFTITGRRVQ
jgi:hypothetical protein